MEEPTSGVDEDRSASPIDTPTGVRRREFLKRTALLGAGLSLAPRLLTDGSAPAAGEALAAASTVGEKVPVRLRINGANYGLRLDPRVSLLDVLREQLDLTGTKKGCNHGQCGACTVLVNGRRVLSCLTLAVTKDGASITTVEGLARNGTLHPLQQAFIDHDAFQCGYCTSGQICSAAVLIVEGTARTADDIRDLMSGNICRCRA